jgi:hypothetical protein
MHLYFIAKRYKDKGPLDIDWNPLSYVEANEKLERFQKQRESLKDSAYAPSYTYFILAISAPKLIDKDNNIKGE